MKGMKKDHSYSSNKAVAMKTANKMANRNKPSYKLGR